MDNSVITCDKIIEGTVPINFNENEATHKTQNFYILLTILSITTTLVFTNY